MLKCETNTPEMRDRIYYAAIYFCDDNGMEDCNVQTHFEHGQWWISLTNGAQYSVNDAEGGDAIDGFCFEQVTEADEY